MKIIEKIKILDTIIQEKEKTELKKLDEKNRLLTSQQIFVLNELKIELMHHIGLKTQEETEKDREYYGTL